MKPLRSCLQIASSTWRDILHTTPPRIASPIWRKLLLVLVILPFVLVNCNQKSKTKANDPTATTIRDNDIVIGVSDADVVILEYMDIQCPACAQWHRVLERTWPLIKDDVKLVIRHYPLTNIHPHAMDAAKLVEAAREQGELYYDFYKKLIENQSSWSKQSSSDATQTFESYAQQVGLDVEKLKETAEDRSIENKVTSDLKLGNEAGVRGTPTILINNQKISIPRDAKDLYNLVKEAQEQVASSASASE